MTRRTLVLSAVVTGVLLGISGLDAHGRAASPPPACHSAGPRVERDARTESKAASRSERQAPERKASPPCPSSPSAIAE
ncbi:conserved hypothetical protein [Streptomyces sp. SPB78]|nr:conserved hypothetical protein [Streptomyces sp. SPB78]